MNTNQEISLDELISGIKNFIFCLDLYKEKINNLNVFPVPDGDTGTNMLLTLRSLDLSDSKNIDVENFLSTLKNSSLMEARGNSGVILSQFFIGLLAAYKKNNSLTLRTLAESIVNAAPSALCEFNSLPLKISYSTEKGSMLGGAWYVKPDSRDLWRNFCFRITDKILLSEHKIIFPL